MRIAIFHRQLDPTASQQVAQLISLLQQRGAEIIDIDPATTPMPKPDFDALLSVGGDGTLLSSVHLIGESGIPVIGVNYGHLGFLTTVGQEVAPEQLVDDIVSGNYSIEERTLLHIDSSIPSAAPCTALNEISLRREYADLLRVNLYVDDEFVAAYEGDGVIVATPTGSTAYSLSCGGPILTPNSGCFVITPIGAHTFTLRPMIVPDSAVIRLEPHYERGTYTLGIDSSYQSMRGGAVFTLNREKHTIRLARMHSQSFFTAIHEKLAWGTELR